MRRSLLVAVSAVATLGIVTAVVVAVLLNHAPQSRPLTAQAHPTSTNRPQPTSTVQPQPTCGSLNYAAGQLMTGTSAAQDSRTCFAKAISACHTATLSATVMGVDTDTTYYFSVSSACKATLAFTNVVIGTRKTSVTTTCQHVTATAESLNFTGCGTIGDIYL